MGFRLVASSSILIHCVETNLLITLFKYCPCGLFICFIYFSFSWASFFNFKIMYVLYCEISFNYLLLRLLWKSIIYYGIRIGREFKPWLHLKMFKIPLVGPHFLRGVWANTWEAVLELWLGWRKEIYYGTLPFASKTFTNLCTKCHQMELRPPRRVGGGWGYELKTH